MRKKGFLLAEETLKIVVAVIVLGFLVYFLGSIYLSSTSAQKEQHAEASLERISDIIENIGAETENVTDITPVGWYLFGFVDMDERPNACSNQNCLCICAKKGLFGNQARKCDQQGICEIVENLDYFEAIKIERPPFVLDIEKTDKVMISKR